MTNTTLPPQPSKRALPLERARARVRVCVRAHACACVRVCVRAAAARYQLKVETPHPHVPHLEMPCAASAASLLIGCTAISGFDIVAGTRVRARRGRRRGLQSFRFARVVYS